MNKEEIEKAKKFIDYYMKSYFYEDIAIQDDFDFEDAIKKIKNYIHHLENKVKELGKGQQTLIKSRRKWKARYYKERRKVKELEENISYYQEQLKTEDLKRYGIHMN